jgi:PAS domain S-box-containing protein/putative nucleotidyltransferase with HDIG domain
MGYKSAELYSKDFEYINLVHPEDKNLVEERMESLSKGKKTNPMYSYRVVNKEEITRHVEVSSIRIPGEKVRILGMLRDISERVKAEDDIKENMLKMQNTIWGTVQALATTAEMRDPYTAGHQSRVTQLSLVLAEKLDLQEEKIDGLRMAGIIHDIGKIQVPAEILSKPSKLTEMEFNLIKGHPQVGYDILKTIEFPYPVDKIVLQHHERMNGSGYPQGLTGKKILYEARILAVADVIEAMASHRPYRPALGIDVALDHIVKEKGILYDSDVVDVCVELFSKKKFQWD